MKLTASTVIQIGPCRETFALPGGEGVLQIHCVGSAPVRVALLTSQTAKVSDWHTILPKQTMQFRLEKNKFLGAHALPQDNPSAHAKLVVSVAE